MEFTLKTTLNTTPQAIYDTWLSSTGHTAMTGGKATASNKVGESFTAWDGYITGKNLILEENKRIVQSWRTSQFEPHEEDSQIEVLLAGDNGTTELTLVHSKVPESGEHYIKGWDEHYFQPMKTYFSKG
ncbi:SRPBCC domain-containing protein [Sediminicola sp. 1XM1-17]|uniref:SRPBCC domain-containing protein n=1 Tax=Sediminicola sp. 1XM1-17 TaxID=3127702 RepID=UPI003077A45F